MDERKELYKFFEGKKVRIITYGNFTYNTSCLNVFESCVKFVDNRGNTILLAFTEIKFIEEVKQE